MKVLLDVNVVLDVLLDREPHVEASAAIWAAVESGMAEGFLPAHALTTIHYLVRKERGGSRAKRVIAALLRVFAVAPVDGTVIRDALELPSLDFEDSVAAAAACSAGCDLVITRDPRGFHGSHVRVLTPEAAVPLLTASR
jgi:predicted nucleic acid-binding protein